MVEMITERMIELKPCPSCYDPEDPTYPTVVEIDGRWHAYCENCSPLSASESDAAHAWNNRKDENNDLTS